MLLFLTINNEPLVLVLEMESTLLEAASHVTSFNQSERIYYFRVE